MQETIRDLLTRRSVRSYSDRQVPDELVDKIAEAGIWAPTAAGRQHTKLVILTDKELIGEISAMNAAVMGSSGDPFYGARTIIIVFSDGNDGCCVEDGALVMGNLLNAAHALGVDSCWIHRAKEVFDTARGRQLKALWGVPDSYIGIGNCILGYGDKPYPQGKDRLPGRIIRG